MTSGRASIQLKNSVVIRLLPTPGSPMTVTTCVFFQGEDGIRDVAVTGVQTCALPISSPTQRKAGAQRGGRDLYRPGANRGEQSAGIHRLARGPRRSHAKPARHAARGRRVHGRDRKGVV